MGGLRRSDSSHGSLTRVTVKNAMIRGLSLPLKSITPRHLPKVKREREREREFEAVNLRYSVSNAQKGPEWRRDIFEPRSGASVRAGTKIRAETRSKSKLKSVLRV